MDNIIDVQHLIKRYDGFTAVDDLSFSVAPGEFFGLLGPNGAGKTTTIRTLYGFSPITEGRVQVFGRDIASDRRVIKARIGVCQQDNTLDPDLSVAQNLLIFAGYFSIPAPEAQRRTVIGGSVPLIACKPVTGVFAFELAHHCIPCSLGED